jgi:pyruvate dehydrogenase E2 component (dihydrolipoamide acetyltransferase)
MATKVIMPKQGLQMTEGTITRWLVAEGDKVEAGKPLFEMETDKTTLEIEANVSGTLLKIIQDVGEVVPITEIIAIIGEPGEDMSAFFSIDMPANSVKASDAVEQNDDNHMESEEAKAGKGEVERIFVTPRAKTVALEKGLNYLDIEGTGPKGLIIERDVLNYARQMAAVPKATPLAAKAAKQNEVELLEVKGSGIRGKVIKADIEAAVEIRKSKTKVETRSGKMIPFSGMRKVISDKMMQSIHGMAQANHKMKVDMSEIIRFREVLKASNIKVTFSDILVKIVSKALLEFPIMNSSLTNEGILLNDYVNMGIAVAIENGLIVPVIKHAELLTLEEISIVSAELIDQAKKGGLKPNEYTGGTFTITNLGMFDIDEFTAIINPPESAILAIGKIDRIPVAEGDNIVIRPVMMLSLTYDHRIIDGAPAALFLQRVKQLMQNPYLLI